MLIVVAACAATCVLTSLLTLALTGSFRRAPQLAERPAPPRVREEDRVRPAINRAGERIWVDEENIEWHEIVTWTWPTDIVPTDIVPADVEPADVELEYRSA